MTWTARTYFDTYPSDENRTHECGGCGRRTAADMLTDMRSSSPRLHAADYICDGCRERLIVVHGRRFVLIALGAPAELLALIPED